MKLKVKTKIGATLLFILGIFEVSAIMFLFAPKEVLSNVNLPWEFTFSVMISFIFGLSRIIAGVGVWNMKMWGIILGIILSTITLIVVPSVYKEGVFGIIDLILAIGALLFLLFSLYGSKTLPNE